MARNLEGRLKSSRVLIEHIRPSIDGGRYRAKAVVGDDVEVSADVFRDSALLLGAVIRYRGPSDRRWSEAPMVHLENDRWAGTFRPTQVGRWRYAIQAWTDHFGSWQSALAKKAEAGLEVELELQEGAQLIAGRLRAMPSARRKRAEQLLEVIKGPPPAATEDDDERVAAALDAELTAIMAACADRSGAAVSKPVLELTVDRERARTGAWYELFPRSTGKPGKHGTLKTAAAALGRVADMGFDVVYLPPIHPIGSAYRKGKNNTLDPHPDDVGVPWAIGSSEGGHTAIHPQLGTMKDFDAFVAEAHRLGMEVALDYAIQCSPDHPWVTEHPSWFRHRPDGSIKYAENPPKKYQDIYPIDFDTDDAAGLWTELKAVLDLWIEHGVRIFRVDNPHTKSFPFWEWVIEAIHDDHPDVIFLAEAFTRPKVMRALAKLGFTQSYTYFTWRNTKHELIEYLTELTQTEMADYFRPNFFANTPDILHEYLQTGGPPAFKIRLVLGALLSPSYGIYSGYELCENVPLHEGSEEYLDSEKYELRPRDWSRENLGGYITLINGIRAKHPALWELTNLRFHATDKDNVLAFSKTAPGHPPILAVVSLNPFHWEETSVHLDLDALGIESWEAFEVHDLLADTTYMWRGSSNYVRLDPHHEPAHVFEIRR
ncbi:MAG: alpha-1,4-glucan--maltose-1-phosphate maltosyltransferase [Actinomycetota bacterium]|nr:alpha-1,4-glucan--maltose-1-phosphate maltosyltransferase [Actinomycetota bacterium]